MTMLIENIRMAITSLLANKSRALLTMLGIIIGIASVIAITTVGNSLTVSVSTSMQSLGASNVTVNVSKREKEQDKRENGIKFGELSYSRSMTKLDYITDDMLYSLLDRFKEEVEAISISETSGSPTVKEGNKSADLNIIGVSQGYFVANDINLLAGRLISDEEALNKRTVAIVSDEFLQDIWGMTADNGYDEALGKNFIAEINNQDIQMTIIGVYEKQMGDAEQMEILMGIANTGTNCYIPLKTAQEINHTEGYKTVSVIAKVDTDSDKLANSIENYLKGFYRDNSYYTINAYSMASMVSIMSDMMNTITLAISIIAGIALLVGGIGVMNIMLVSITERTREIGTRKALGATNGSIRTQFIIESMIMCFIGGAIGVVLGIVAGLFGAHLLGYDAAPSMSSIVTSLIFSLGIGLFFGYYPANKAAKMNPIDALRYE